MIYLYMSTITSTIRATMEAPTPTPTWASRGKAAGPWESYCTRPREKFRFPILTYTNTHKKLLCVSHYWETPQTQKRTDISWRTVNSRSVSAVSRFLVAATDGCCVWGSQYRWFLVRVFTAHSPSPIRATTSSLDMARSRFSPYNPNSTPTQSFYCIVSLNKNI